MKGYLFDLDGVIADTATYHFEAWQELVKKHFNQTLPGRLEEKTKGVSREDSLKVILDHLHVIVSEEEFKELADEKNRFYVDSLDRLTSNDILPGIKKLLADIKNDGGKIALASASKNGPLILEKLGILEEFDAIVNPNVIKRGKPAPDIFLAAADAIHVAPNECIAIEDSIAGIKAINQSGAYSVAVGGDELVSADKRVLTTSDLNYDELKSLKK
ncbi:beta-phosphoglucomutase [Streptococcus gallolyticus]|uniref:Beta-phosphoglucomutase n=1 Tax=Streptococcus gallolyticus TaxID=315405 RepID=A0A1H7UQI5_9STRE|nr:beta-phosphoglucomutase [Streptococcus gallolyticus]SEF19088.1 beta-phosphoglucomutase [Streptococcus gallolyticus]SEL99054.1 beta-phosphoglucomutase [Streptococcus gallolyticus]